MDFLSHIIRTNPIELIMFISGFGFIEIINKNVLSAFGMSFITLMIVFKIFTMSISSTVGDKKDYEDMTNIFRIGKMLGTICLLVGLVISTVPVGIYTTHITKNIDTEKIYDDLLRKPEEFTLTAKEFKLGDKVKELFGDTWFKVDIDYYNVWYATSMKGLLREKQSGDVYTANLPIYRALPIILIDRLLYGKDGTSSKDEYGNIDGGIVHMMFGANYSQLIADPKFLFDNFADNSIINTRKGMNNLLDRYTELTTQQSDLVAYTNYRTTKLISNFNLYPINWYKHNQKEHSKYQFDPGLVKKKDEALIKLSLAYNKRLARVAGNLVGNDTTYLGEVDDAYFKNPNLFLFNESNLFENKFGRSNKLYLKDTVNNRPLYDDVETKDKYVALYGKMTLLDLFSPESKDKMLNDYTMIRNININQNTNIFDIQPHYYFTQSGSVKSMYDVGTYTNKLLTFNLFDKVYEKPNDATADKNIFNFFMRNIIHLEDNVILKMDNQAKSVFKLGGIGETSSNVNWEQIEQRNTILTVNLEKYFKFYFPTDDMLNDKSIKDFIRSKPEKDISPFLKLSPLYEEIGYELIQNHTRFDWRRYIYRGDENFNGGFTFSSNGSNLDYFVNMAEREDFDVVESTFIKSVKAEMDETKREIQNRLSQIRTSMRKVMKEKNELMYSKTSKKLKQELDREFVEKNLFNFDNVAKSHTIENRGYFETARLNVANVILGLVDKLFSMLLDRMLSMFKVLLGYLFALIYSTQHGVGVLISLFMMPIVVLQSIFTNNFKDPLIMSTKKYISYRIRDIPILLVVVVLSVLSPRVLRFFGTIEYSSISKILRILFLFSIFSFISIVQTMVSEGLNLPKTIDFYSSVSKKAMTPITMRGQGAMIVSTGAVVGSAGGVGRLATASVDGIRNTFSDGDVSRSVNPLGNIGSGANKMFNGGGNGNGGGGFAQSFSNGVSGAFNEGMSKGDFSMNSNNGGDNSGMSNNYNTNNYDSPNNNMSNPNSVNVDMSGLDNNKFGERINGFENSNGNNGGSTTINNNNTTINNNNTNVNGGSSNTSNTNGTQQPFQNPFDDTFEGFDKF